MPTKVTIKKKKPVIQTKWESNYKCTDYMFVSTKNIVKSNEKKLRLIPIKYYFKEYKNESLNRIDNVKLLIKEFQKYVSKKYELENEKDFKITRMYSSDTTVIYLIFINDFSKSIKSMKSMISLELANASISDNFQGIIDFDSKNRIKKNYFSNSLIDNECPKLKNITKVKPFKVFKTLIDLVEG